MIVSSRTILALGLGMVGIGLLVGPSLGQQDGGVRKAAGQTSAAAPGAAPKAPEPAIVGTIDLEKAFKEYDKVKALSEEYQAYMMAKRNELMKLTSEGQQETEVIQKLTPGSVDFKKHESKITELKVKVEAYREQAQRDLQLREAEMMAIAYKEVQDMVARIAQFRGMTYVVKVNNSAVSAANPNSVLAAMDKTIIYADPNADITRDVVYNLNRAYKAAGGTAPKGNTATPAAPAAPGARPAGN